MSDEHSPSISHGRAMALNPAAGFHPVSADRLEVAAASRASERSLTEFPYYLERYGERSRLFGLSDGAWIVTLCANPDASAIQTELTWLAKVLSSRGMPSIMLEKHLAFMEDELTRALPKKRDEYARLGVARTAMETARNEILQEDEFGSLAAAFERAADRETASRLKGMGQMLVSAAIDEAAGTGRAVTSLEDWAADPTRFSAEWVNAVKVTIKTARMRVGYAAPDGAPG